MTGSFLYRLAGLTLRSERRLPYLLPHPADAPSADVVIRFAPLPDLAATPALVMGPCRVYSPSLIEIATDRGLRIRAHAGREVIVDAPHGMGDGELHTMLFGAAFAMLCHQRGCPPLHASAVAFGDHALAIAGHQGAGKTTTARALLQRGGKLLTDDQLVVAPDTGVAAPGFPSAKLWANTAHWFGEALDHAERIRPDIDKYHLPAGAHFHTGEAAVKLVFVLTPARDAQRVEARRLQRAEAVAALDCFVYRSDMAAALGSRAAIFAWASRLGETLPVYHLRRADDFARLDELTDTMLEIAGSHGVTAPSLERTP